MNPWYHGYEEHVDLREDDRLAIQQIYGSREKIWGDNPRPRTRPPMMTTTTPRSYYPDKNPSDRDRDRQRQIEEKERQERERQRQIEYDLKRKEWERQQKKRLKEQQEREEKDRREKAWDEENERRRYNERTGPNTQPTRASTPTKPWHHNHNTHQKHNKNGPKKEKPDTCNTSYDAITIIRSELFIFRDRVSVKQIVSHMISIRINRSILLPTLVYVAHR